MFWGVPPIALLFLSRLLWLSCCLRRGLSTRQSLCSGHTFFHYRGECKNSWKSSLHKNCLAPTSLSLQGQSTISEFAFCLASNKPFFLRKSVCFVMTAKNRCASDSMRKDMFIRGWYNSGLSYWLIQLKSRWKEVFLNNRIWGPPISHSLQNWFNYFQVVSSPGFSSLQRRDDTFFVALAKILKRLRYSRMVKAYPTCKTISNKHASTVSDMNTLMMNYTKQQIPRVYIFSESFWFRHRKCKD